VSTFDEQWAAPRLEPGHQDGLEARKVDRPERIRS
jgi:hypothetical protein